jgi:hypothetical protein
MYLTFSKNEKISQNDKLEISLYCSTKSRSVIFGNLKYSIFHFENLHMGRLHYCLSLVFFFFSQMFEFKFSEGSKKWHTYSLIYKNQFSN